MAKPRRYCWDSCTWISLILDESIVASDGNIEDRGIACRHIIDQASRGTVEIATSTLSITEVCKHPNSDMDDDQLSDFFRNEYILLASVDRHVATYARSLMRKKLSGLKPPDAIHLATAVVSRSLEFHTFDERLLKLDGRIEGLDGEPLKVCKPHQPPRTLFSGMRQSRALDLN